jgi:hypothetical protein
LFFISTILVKINIPFLNAPSHIAAGIPNSNSQWEIFLVISGGGRGLHWESIDEDISVRGLLLGRADVSLSKISRSKKAA